MSTPDIYVVDICEGWRGSVIANGDAQGTFYKHIKRYADKAVASENRDLPR